MHPPLSEYTELHALSHFSFLKGASSPQELIETAQHLGYRGLALTDECSLAGIVRAHVAAQHVGLPLIVGAAFQFAWDPELSALPHWHLVLLVENRLGYAELSHLITRARRRSPKGDYQLSLADMDPPPKHCLILWYPDLGAPPEDLLEQGLWLADHCPDRAWMGVEEWGDAGRENRDRLRHVLCTHTALPLVCSGNVHIHDKTRQDLQDVMTAIRLNTPLSALGFELHANAERTLRPLERIQKIFKPAWIAATNEIRHRCQFTLKDLRYEYPEELAPPGLSPSVYLRQLTEAGFEARFSEAREESRIKVWAQIEHELTLIQELSFAPFFLTVYDIVRFARSRGILCQGRGSAANSAVCYCLGITEVDPSRMDMLFERFISKERHEPPDIDVDFEHHRREEVIQYVYAKYGRHRAALAATVICYRAKSAIRDVGKALGLPPEKLEHLATHLAWWDGQSIQEERLLTAGFDPSKKEVQVFLNLVKTLIGSPRHLSQHVGGFVIAREQLADLVPIENAAMPERTIIQWDKDDLDTLGLLKVDCLALGMLHALQQSLLMIGALHQRPFGISDIPAEDPRVYDMISRADTIGVFQIESRAQMSMLPRLKPRTYYDLVIEVAIVRPGPIQGGMVHPYLRRRQGLEPVRYPSSAVKSVLKRTLGVPIFQEQVMQLAVVAAGFTPGQADQLRRSMAAWKKKGGLDHFQSQIIEGMTKRGYSLQFAEQLFLQIEGFGKYGFPESHAASFALLVYASAWIKCHYPAVFTCALLNAQPMGFYGPSQLIQDAKAHGVTVLPVDILKSDWTTRLESKTTLRLGLHLVKGLGQSTAERLLKARDKTPFQSIEGLVFESHLDEGSLRALSQADALRPLVGHRHQSTWHIEGVKRPLPLFATGPEEAPCLLPAPHLTDEIRQDYESLGLSLKGHPLQHLRPLFQSKRLLSAHKLSQSADRALVRAAGLVTCRQRPETAAGITFVTLEDETGFINVIVPKALSQRQRTALLGAHVLVVFGVWQRQGAVTHLLAKRLVDGSHYLQSLKSVSRDFH